jgi:hypothetical protein
MTHGAPANAPPGRYHTEWRLHVSVLAFRFTDNPFDEFGG